MACPRRLRALVLTLFLTACAGAGPAPTPGDLVAVEQALVLRGVTIASVVGGDPGCAGSDLHDNAVRLDVRLADEPPRSLYLFRWRRAEQFEAAAHAYGECLRSFAATASLPVAALELRPWRAFGAGWSDALHSTIEDALQAVGGG